MPLPASSSQRKRNPPSHIPHSHGRDAHPLIRTGFCIDTKLIKVRLSIEMHILIAFLLFGFARVAKAISLIAGLLLLAIPLESF
jgi:hypothetical protein